MRVEPFLLCLSYHSVTGPLAQPEAKSRWIDPSKNNARVEAISVFDGARDGVRTAGSRAKDERWIASSKSANSSSMVACLEDSIKRGDILLVLFAF